MSQVQRAVEQAFVQIDRAQFDPSLWQPALRSIADATGSSLGHLMSWSEQDYSSSNIFSEPWDDNGEEWIALGGADPTINPFINPSIALGAGHGILDTDVVSETERRRNPLLNEFRSKRDLEHLCIFKLTVEPKAHRVLICNRARRQGPFVGADRITMRRIGRRAVIGMRNALALRNEGTKILSASLSALSLTVFVCDAEGQVVTMSEKAEATLRSGEFVWLDGRRLSARTYAATQAIERTIRSALESYSGGASDLSPRTVLPNASGKPVANVTAVALPLDRHNIGRNAAVLLIVQANPSPSDSRIAAQAKLTKSETAVFSMLLTGVRLDRIASDRRVSRETVRSQAKAIYEKTGVGSQVELIARYGK